MFLKQFIGRLTWPTLITIAVVHVLAVFVRDTGFEFPLIIVLAAATFALAWKKLEYGLFIAFAEIFIGGHGHLLAAEVFGFSLSIRIALFGIVMLVWLIKLLKKDVQVMVVPIREAPWLVLIAGLAIGTLVGFLNNEAGKAFDDMNGYLTLFYLLPMISIKWDQVKKREFLQVFAASSAWLVFFTLLLSYLFTHLDGKSLNHVYRFVRDARLAEITLQTVSNADGTVTNAHAARLLGADGYWYRVFMQSHFYVMSALTMMISAVYFVWRSQRLPWKVSLMFALLVSVLPLSLSRSFLLGLGVAGLVLVLLSLTNGKKKMFSTIKQSGVMVVLGVVGLVFALLTIVVPIPPQPDISDAAFYSTSADADRELAVSSRWQLLGPMNDAIWRSPIIGSGFGKEVTFISDDPRVRAINPNGEWTTYRFEWGYQDIWLKMGVLGLLAFLLYAYLFAKAVVYSARKHSHAWLVFGFAAGMILLFVAHAFSPFLNHPIGLAYMLFVLPFLDYTGLQKKLNEEREKRKKLVPQPKLKPVTRETES